MPWPTPATLLLEKRGDGIEVLTSTLQQMEGDHPKGPETVDSGSLGENLQLSEGRENTSVKN